MNESVSEGGGGGGGGGGGKKKEKGDGRRVKRYNIEINICIGISRSQHQKKTHHFVPYHKIQQQQEEEEDRVCSFLLLFILCFPL